MLRRLSLKNFRNHKKFELDLDQTTVLVGLNGAGKSNVLEALSLLSFCRSFRESERKNLINFEADYARITADDLEIFLAKMPRTLMQMKERGVVKKTVDFVGSLPAVVFSAETLDVITGSPSDRRRFLDIVVSQTDKQYLKSLIEYNKVKKNRNNLLVLICKGEAKEEELKFWDKELVRLSFEIVKKRENAILFLNKYISEEYGLISGSAENRLEIDYLKNLDGNMEKKIIQYRPREIACKKTLLGPHRDDLVFTLNGSNMANFASRGEIRSAVLALKISELKFLEDRKKEKNSGPHREPILLLDDIFSEFDPVRREHLSDIVLKYQALITTTEKSHLSDQLLKKAKIVEL